MRNPLIPKISPNSSSEGLAEYYRLRRRLAIAFTSLVAVTLVGIVGFSVIGGQDTTIIDAVYMTIITLTTVGFGEIVDMTNHPAGRVFTIMLLVGGMGIVAYSVPLTAAFIIEGQLFHPFARRRMQKTIAQLEGHFIVCGDTAATSYVAEELTNTNRRVVLVIPEEDSLSSYDDALEGVPRIVGDPSDDSVLLSAGLSRGAGVVACMESDKDNLLIVLTARRLAPTTRIVAATARADTDVKLRAAGADAVVCPNRTGGMRMASELIRPRVVSFLDQMLRDRSSLRVEEITVPREAESIGKPLEALKIDALPGALLLAVRHPKNGAYEFKPPADLALEPGMTLVIMADAEARSKLEEQVIRG